MAMFDVGTFSTHWPHEQLKAIVAKAEPNLVFELRAKPGNPGEQFYGIRVEAETRGEASELGKRVIEALKGVPSGNDRDSVYAPQGK